MLYKLLSKKRGDGWYILDSYAYYSTCGAKKNTLEDGEPSDRLNKSRLKLALSSSFKTVHRTPTRELQDLPQTALSQELVRIHLK